MLEQLLYVQAGKCQNPKGDIFHPKLLNFLLKEFLSHKNSTEVCVHILSATQGLAEAVWWPHGPLQPLLSHELSSLQMTQGSALVGVGLG